MKVIDQTITDRYALYHGDSSEVLKELPEASVHYTIYSPPFCSLYMFSDSERDLSNCANPNEFFEQFKYIVSELYRVTMAGRLMSVHCCNLPTTKNTHGFIGITDFRGDLIRLFQQAGFIFHSEVCIWKDPVSSMQRTKSIRLLYKQLKKDSSLSGQGLPDYLITMRKPGENPEPVTKTEEGYPLKDWQETASPVWEEYPSPVWMDIAQGNVLPYRGVKEEKDEKHMCPLQLPVIKRAVELWTNKNDIVLSPFAGIGSELYVSLELGRRAIGVELKDSYYKQMVLNCAAASGKKGLLLD